MTAVNRRPGSPQCNTLSWQAAGIMLVGGLAACAPRVTPPPAVSRSDTDPAAVYAAVRRDEGRVRALRARFSVRVHRGDEIRDAYGVLLVKKPDQFRVRLLSAFGLTVFDYVSRASHAQMSLPLEGKRFLDAEITDKTAFSPADMRQAFLRGSDAFPGSCSAQAEQGETVVTCKDPSDRVLRLIRIAPGTSTIRQEISFVSAQPQLVMQFGDHRPVDGLELPFAIELSYPERMVHLSITVRSYEVNPTLPDSLFDDAPTGTVS